MRLIRIKLLKVIDAKIEEIIEKTNRYFSYPVVSICCNQVLLLNDFVPVLVEDENGQKYTTLFCKECSSKIGEWFEVLDKALIAQN